MRRRWETSPGRPARSRAAVSQRSVAAHSRSQLNPHSQADPPLALAGTTVRVNGLAAPIFFASPEEVVFVVPDGVADGPAEIVVTNSDGFSSKASVVIASSAPGIFTVKGDGEGEGDHSRCRHTNRRPLRSLQRPPSASRSSPPASPTHRTFRLLSTAKRSKSKQSQAAACAVWMRFISWCRLSCGAQA